MKESRIKIAQEGQKGVREFGAGNCKCSLFLCTFLCPFALSADWAAELSQEEGRRRRRLGSPRSCFGSGLELLCWRK